MSHQLSRNKRVLEDRFVLQEHVGHGRRATQSLCLVGDRSMGCRGHEHGWRAPGKWLDNPELASRAFDLGRGRRRNTRFDVPGYTRLCASHV